MQLSVETVWPFFPKINLISYLEFQIKFNFLFKLQIYKNKIYYFYFEKEINIECI